MPSTILDRTDRSTDREALHRDPNLVLYRTRAGFTAVTQLTSSDGQVDQRFFDVNAPGRDLLALVDGHRSLADIATEYCRSTDLDVDPNRSWIDDYFTAVRERGVVFAGEPHDDPALKEIGHGGLLRPVHLTVEITDACNLECQHCYLEASPAKQARMTFAEFQRVVGAFQENQGLSIELTGGEVFCNPEWKPILELALEQFSLVGLLTNATVLPADALQLLTRYADRVTVGVSIDSVRPELHDRLRGRRHAFERTIRNVRRLVATGVRVRVGSVIFDENMWEVRELAHLAVDLGAAMFSFNYVEDFGRGHAFRSDHDVTFDTSYKEYIEGVLNDFSGIIPVIAGEQTSGTLNCGAGVGSIVVDPHGNVRPCAIYPRTQAFGNVLEADWPTVFDAPIHSTFAAVPAPHHDHGCPLDCQLFGHCYGCVLKGLRQNADRPAGERCPWVLANDLHGIVDRFAESIGAEAQP